MLQNDIIVIGALQCFGLLRELRAEEAVNFVLDSLLVTVGEILKERVAFNLLHLILVKRLLR